MLKENYQNYLKTIIILILIPFIIPLITTAIDILFNLGVSLGSYARNISICA